MYCRQHWCIAIECAFGFAIPFLRFFLSLRCAALGDGPNSLASLEQWTKAMPDHGEAAVLFAQTLRRASDTKHADEITATLRRSNALQDNRATLMSPTVENLKELAIPHY